MPSLPAAWYVVKDGLGTIAVNKMEEESTASDKHKTKLDTSLLKGFVAGVVFSHINKRLVLGFLVGSLAGAYIQQNYDDIPNVEEVAQHWIAHVRRALNNKDVRKD